MSCGTTAIMTIAGFAACLATEFGAGGGNNISQRGASLLLRKAGDDGIVTIKPFCPLAALWRYRRGLVGAENLSSDLPARH
ncbi:hypothetical protein NYV46_12615 [Escherichia coli]|nr:hypothetical protein [Escherichia coli]